MGVSRRQNDPCAKNDTGVEKNTNYILAVPKHNPIPKKKKKKRTNRAITAESQDIVAQGNSNPYNTALLLSRLQMVYHPPHLADVNARRRMLLQSRRIS